MGDDLGASEDERAIELSSIEAIYPEIKIDAADPFTAILELPVVPEKPLKIYFQSSADGAPLQLPTPSNSEGQSDEDKAKAGAIPALTDTHELSYLPPITIKITLPAGYPVQNPPAVQLFCTPQWMPNTVMKSLVEDCTRLWEEMGRDQVVFMYIDHLQQASEKSFGVAEEASKGHIILPADLKLSLLDFDLRTRKIEFEKGSYDCGICLEPKKGAVCHRLSLCGHVFCVACLQDFYNTCITEGDVDSVKCLAPDCGKTGNSISGKRRKHDRTLNPSELLQIPIEQENVQRYVRLKRKKKLESDKNTIYCPRQWCQGAAKSKKHPKPTDMLNDFSESESEPEEAIKKKKKPDEDTPMSERLCVCEDCNFAFCSVCKKGWHGELARCNPRRQAELNAEEKASLDYMKRFSTPCPTCNAPSQKTHGCNHMVCFKCKTHFCYLCSAYLMPENPYKHFNELKSNCYMRLWELEGGDGLNPGAAFDDAGDDGGWVADLDDRESEAGSDSDDDDELHEDLIEILDLESSDDDEPPPPPHRRPANQNMHIEIVNFAGNGAQRRIELPNQPRAPQQDRPPPVPQAPRRRRRRGQGQQGNRQRQMQQEPQRRAVAAPLPAQAPALAAPAVRPAEARLQPQINAAAPVPAPPAAAALPNINDAPPLPRNLPLAAPGQGPAHQNHNLPPGPARAMGLERFLELAMNDQEDEWDSDELDEMDDVVIEDPAGRNHRRRMRWRGDRES